MTSKTAQEDLDGLVGTVTKVVKALNNVSQAVHIAVSRNYLPPSVKDDMQLLRTLEQKAAALDWLLDIALEQDSDLATRYEDMPPIIREMLDGKK